MSKSSTSSKSTVGSGAPSISDSFGGKSLTVRVLLPSFFSSFFLSASSWTGLAMMTVAAASSIRLFSSAVVTDFPFLSMRIPVISMTLFCSRSVSLFQDFLGFSPFFWFSGPNRRPEVDGISDGSFSGSSLSRAVDVAASSMSGDCFGTAGVAGVAVGAEAEAEAAALVSSGVGWWSIPLYGGGGGRGGE